MKGSLKEFMIWFNKLNKSIDSGIKEGFHREAYSILRTAKQYTPIDTGNLSKNWKVSEYDANGDKKNAIITNEETYASPIEYGSPIGGRPWPSPGDRTTSSGGRIFSIQAVGGVTAAVERVSNFDQIAEHMAHDIVKRIK